MVFPPPGRATAAIGQADESKPSIHGLWVYGQLIVFIDYTWVDLYIDIG